MVKTFAALLVCGAMFWAAEACHADGGCHAVAKHHVAVVHRVAVVRYRAKAGPIRRLFARRPVRQALRGLLCCGR